MDRLKALETMEMSRLRVAERVAHGDHQVPGADIERRFARSLSNLLHVFSAQVDACRCFLNSDATPELVFEQQGDVRNVVQQRIYQHLLREAQT